MENTFWHDLNNQVMEGTQFLNSILESMSIGVYLVNLQGVIIYWNRMAEQITGYKREEMIGKQCGELPNEICLEGGCPAGILECGLFTSGQMVTRECRLTAKNGRLVYIMKSARIVKDDNERPMMGIINIMDVTKIKDAAREIDHLRTQLEHITEFENIIGDAPAMHKIYADINLAAKSDTSVLITGESGTGKELAAMAIHSLSNRRNMPFITINCCSLPETLLESELFGHQKGSFTGAVRDQIGRFEAANGGTLFIDEVGELPLVVQVKLLRFLQEKTIERLGEVATRKLDVRIISATNHDLGRLVRERFFREDLYYRINVFPIVIPSLRQRKTDIPLLAHHFLDKFAKKTGKNIKGFNNQAMEILISYNWPGNVRELENAIEHAFVRVQTDTIEVYDLPENIIAARKNTLRIQSNNWNKTLTRETILKKLAENEWRRQETAAALGISRITLWKKMKALGIHSP